MSLQIESLQRKINTSIPHRVTGLFASKKNKHYIAWESQLERDVCVLLERDSNVISYKTQSVAFIYYDQGKRRKYTPDFFVEYADGQEVYLEVKPQKFLEKFKIDKNIVLEEITRKNIIFKIITEIDIRCGYFLENIKYLEFFSDIPIEQKTLDVINGLKKSQISIKSLGNFVPLEQIYHLIYRDYFDLDMNTQLINENSMLGLCND